MSYQVICVLGSSTANGYWDEEGLGWVARLSMKVAKAYPYKFGFNNLAQSGDTSLDMLHRLSAEALSRDPDILIFSGGGNDLNRWGSPEAATELSEEKTKQNWRTMLSLAKKNNKKILIVGLTPVKETASDVFDSKIYKFNRDNIAYNQKLKKWCEDYSADFLDLTDIWTNENISEYVYDNVHPNAKGHQLIAETVFKKLDEMNIFKTEAE
jgi:lysophospholipase L1-like esterase